jgi:hypothetical protein
MAHNSLPPRRGSRKPGGTKPPTRHPSLRLSEVLVELAMSRTAFYRLRDGG